MGSALHPRQARQRALAWILAFCGLAVMAIVAWKSWHLCVEEWHIAKLRSGDREAEEHAAIQLAAMASVRAVPQLIEVIARRYDGEEVASNRATHPDELTFLARDGGQTRWVDKCSEAIAALGVKALSALEEKLSSREPRERLWAAYKIGRLGPDAAGSADKLFALLSDEDRRVRRHAARAIGAVGCRSPEILDRLGEALRTRANSRQLRESCLWALLGSLPTPGMRFNNSQASVWLLESVPLQWAPLESHSSVLAILAEASLEEDDVLRPAIIKGLFDLLDRRQLGRGVPARVPSFDPQPVLIRLAADRDGTVRSTAVQFLVRAATFDEPTLAALTRALHDRELSVRKVALAELKALGLVALPVWMAALKSDEPVSPETAAALAAMGTQAEPCWPLLLALLPKLEEDSIPSVAKALGRIGAPSGMGVPELISSLRSPSAGARRGAAEALEYYGRAASRAGPALLDALDDGDPSVRTSAALSLVSTRGVPIESLSEKAVPVLVACLSDESYRTRRRAGEALGALGPAAKAAVPALVDTLRSPDGHVNDWALLTLGNVGPEAWPAVPAVLSILKADEGQDLRNAFRVIKSIGREPELTIPVLQRYLTEPHALYTAFAADALTPFGEKSLPLLVEALSSESHRVRDAAIRSLGQLGPVGKAALPALARVETQDPLERLRVQAGLARERIASGLEQ